MSNTLSDSVDPTDVHEPTPPRVRQDKRSTPTRTEHERHVQDGNDLCEYVANVPWGDRQFMREVRAATIAALLRSGAQVRDEGGDK